MYKISKHGLKELFSLISNKKSVYIPIENKGEINFEKWSSDKEVCLNKLNTIKSAKDLFFPQSENLVAFKREGKNISIIDNRDECESFVIFGVRQCDAASFEILDRVFLSNPVDTYYKRRRENGIVITLACNEPEETCFCTTFGLNPASPKGDIATWIVGDMIYWDHITDKGKSFTETIKDIFTIADSQDEKILEEHKKEIDSILKKLPLNNLSLEGFDEESLNEKFNSPKWKDLSQGCIGCGTCTFICPTCQCYDIKDYDTGHGIKRFRCWDSCMYSDFTKMAHGNPRISQLERFRQRFMHKLIYFPANNQGVYSCVGCGRCISKCPISMNIVKVIRSVGGKKDV